MSIGEARVYKNNCYIAIISESLTLYEFITKLFGLTSSSYCIFHGNIIEYPCHNINMYLLEPLLVQKVHIIIGT